MAGRDDHREQLILALVRESLDMLCRNSELARRNRDDLEGRAVEKLHRSFERRMPANPGGFVHVTVRNLLADLASRRDVNPGVLDDHAMARLTPARVSLPLMQKEAARRLRLAAALVIELMPSEDDRALLYDRFYSGKSLRELGAEHGGVGEAAVSNRINRLLANGAPVFDLVGDHPSADSMGEANPWLSVPVLDVLARLVTKAPPRRTVEEQIDAAIGYLHNLAADSPAHELVVRAVVPRLRWLAGHVPNNRGARNKIARRLVELMCAYVMEPRDARRDELGAEGLLDDARLVEAVQWMVRRNETVKD